MKQVTPELRKYANQFYEENRDAFKASINNYNTLVEELRIPLGFKNPCEVTFDQLLIVDNEHLKEKIINVGFDFYDLKKASRKKEASEFLVQDSGMSLQFLKACEEVNHYFEIKDRIIKIDSLLTSIKNYQEGSLDEEGKRKLYLQINMFQNNFNNHHLKKYAKLIFGISYSKLIEIKDTCFKQTFNSYATILISKDGTTYTKRDGTESR